MAAAPASQLIAVDLADPLKPSAVQTVDSPVCAGPYTPSAARGPTWVDIRSTSPEEMRFVVYRLDQPAAPVLEETFLREEVGLVLFGPDFVALFLRRRFARAATGRPGSASDPRR